MNLKLLAALLITGLACAMPARADDVLETMPAELETRFALSAAPPALRERATVYLLDPAKGYRLARQGSNGQECLVQRTVWELGDFRDDIYFPLCYDAAGAGTYLKVIRDAASLRYPFVDRQGIGEQSYSIQMMGESEKAAILSAERELVQALCGYREVLCLDGHAAH